MTFKSVRMKVAVTVNMQFSLFSSGSSGASLAIADVFKHLGHDVWLVNTVSENTWWDDCNSLKDVWKNNTCTIQQIRQGVFPSDGKQFDLFLEVDKHCFSNKEERRLAAKQSVWVIRKSPIFHDIEASLFPFDSSIHCFEGLTATWLFDLTCTTEDLTYIECIARCPAYFVPFVWTPVLVEAHRSEIKAPEWIQITEAFGKEKPWTVHICETNNTSRSSLTIPLVIVKNCKKQGQFPVNKWVAHNAEHVDRSEFFRNNVKAHCADSDLSGNFAGRQRIIDWIFDPKSCILSHMRFSQLRPYQLDAVWSGIPMVHNSQWIRDVIGAGYEHLYYPDNEIVAGTKALQHLESDWNSRSGIFTLESRNKVRNNILLQVTPYSVEVCNKWKSVVERLPATQETSNKQTTPVAEVKQYIPQEVSKSNKRTVNVLFTDMWDDFNPEYNMFILMMNEAGRHLDSPVRVIGKSIETIGKEKVDICIFGPFGNEWTTLDKSIPKVHYTGENSQMLYEQSVKLNIGYQHVDHKNEEYLRIPLWMLEIDWFGCDKARIVNPKPLPIDRCTKVYPEELSRKKKFCAFVVTNPCNSIRNDSFHWLNKYKPVDSAGRLFNNVGDVIFAGRGGGGGELKKFEFLRDYKFCLSYENSSSQGYTTEKYLHAKAAGCIPIYWGDPKVERDFDVDGFIDARQFTSEEQLIEAVKKVDENASLWMKKYSIPALDDTRRDFVRRVLSECAYRLLKISLNSDAGLDKIPRFLGATNDEEAAKLAELREKEDSKQVEEKPSTQIQETQTISTVYLKQAVQKKPISSIVLATYATKRFLPSLHQWAIAIQVQKKDPSITIEADIWLGADVDTTTEKELQKNFDWIRFHRLPEDNQVEGFPDIWAAEHFAWKLWILNHLVQSDTLKGKMVLYLDSGVFMCRWPTEWMYITKENGLCVLEDPRETNGRWCHDIFCQRMSVSEEEKAQKQIWAGAMSFEAGHPLPTEVFAEAWKWGQIREVIVGPKWAGFKDGQPFGHRHDQSILSILSLRKNIPRFLLDNIYCGESLRRTFMTKKAFYVHRGAFTVHKPFLNEIDDCYVINLDRRADRLEKLYANSPELVNRLQRVSAVDGKTLQLTPAIARLFRPHDFNWKKSVMGCALSHLEVWWQLANERDDINSYLILEDDVKFKPGWEQKWKDAVGSLPEGWDVIYLGGILPPNREGFEKCKERVNEHFSRVGENSVFGQNPPNRYFHWCNYSYVLSKVGARKVLEVLKNKDGFWTSGDHMVCNLVGILNMYFLDPLVSGCYQDDDPTYQTSAFNDFTRVDKFDSDLWNNNEQFHKGDADALAKLDAPLDIPHALSDAKLCTPIESTTPEVKVGEESTENAKHHLVEVMKDDTDPHWKTIYGIIKNEDYVQGREFVFYMLEHFSPIWWSRSISDFESLASILRTKIIQGTPPQDTLQKWKKEILIHSDEYPEKVNILINALNSLLVLAPVSESPPFKSKRRVLALKEQRLTSDDLYEASWIRELFGSKQQFEIETIQPGSPPPTDCPIVVIMRPFWNEWLNLLTEWKAAGSKFYILHLSDEMNTDPLIPYGWDECLGVVRTYWREELYIYGDKVVVIPLGYHWSKGVAGIDEPEFRTPRLPFREYIWSFLGTDWNGRQEKMKNLTLLQPHKLTWFKEWNDAAMVKKDEYLDIMLNSRFIPAPGGVNPETYRFYEALECGCIPLYIRQEGDEMLVEKHYKQWLPIISLPNWDHAAALVYELSNNIPIMEDYRHKLLTGYAAWKKDLGKRVRKIFALEEPPST